MNQNQANRRPSVAPRHTRNTRAQGNAQVDLPKAAHSASLLQLINRRRRSTNADGSFNNNVPYLILTPQSRAERRTLVTDISNFLGHDMIVWHEALHRPQRLPENALDWSTVLLQRTYDLARSMPGNGTATQGLQGVYQAMSIIFPDSRTSNWVHAALEKTNVASAASATSATSATSAACSACSAPASSSSPSEIHPSKSAVIKRLQGQVKDLQEKLEEKQLEPTKQAPTTPSDNDKTGEMRTTAGAEKALSQPQDGIRPFEEDEDEDFDEEIWADYEGLKEFADTKRELEEKPLEMNSLMSASSSDGISEGGNESAAYSSFLSPPPSYLSTHSASSSEASEEL